MLWLFSLLAQATDNLSGDNGPFGTVQPPKGVGQLTDPNSGLIFFISNLIKLATIVAGLWVLFNFITAGYIFITGSSDSASANKVKDQLTSSVLGLVVIVMAYTLIALISFFLFRDPGYILNPTISGPTTSSSDTTTTIIQKHVNPQSGP